jgi:hypothetical protein
MTALPPEAAVFNTSFGLPITSDKVASRYQGMTTIGHLFAGQSTPRHEFDKTQLNQCGRINGRDKGADSSRNEQSVTILSQCERYPTLRNVIKRYQIISYVNVLFGVIL